MTRAVLFDLDETLLDRTASLEQYLHGYLERMDWRHPDFVRRYLELDNRGYTTRPRLYGQLAAEFDPPWSAEQSLRDFWDKAWLECVLFPEAVEVLEQLKLGHKLGVITNGGTVTQQRKLDVSGLTPLFDVILISESEGIAKPDARIFRRACERLGLESADAVFVGDHPVNDIAGAQGAGLRAVWRSGVWPRHPDIVPDATVTSLLELSAHL